MVWVRGKAQLTAGLKQKLTVAQGVLPRDRERLGREGGR